MSILVPYVGSVRAVIVITCNGDEDHSVLTASQLKTLRRKEKFRETWGSGKVRSVSQRAREFRRTGPTGSEGLRSLIAAFSCLRLRAFQRTLSDCQNLESGFC
jgi:hypothetical protein